MDELAQTEPKKKGRRPGIYSWLRTGRVNPSIRGHKALQTYLMTLERELTELQGAGGMTAGREILIKSTVEAFGVVLLSAMFCKREGVIRPDMARHGVIELQPVLGKQFLAFMNSIRQNLVVLGLDRRRADDILDLSVYLETKAAAERGATVDKGGEKIGVVTPSGKAVSGSLGENLKNDAFSGDGQAAGDGPICQPARPGGEIRGNEGQGEDEK
jgi:hypothetical protein